MSEVTVEENEVDECTFYKFRREDVDAVNVANWKDTFQPLCPNTVLLRVPPDVLKYLKSDGMVMPQDTHTTAHLNLSGGGGGKKKAGGGGDGDGGAVEEEGEVADDDEDDDNVSWASISDMEEPPCIPSQFLQKISRPQRGGGEGRRGRQGSNGEGCEDVDGKKEVDDEEEEELEETWDRPSSSSSEEDVDGAAARRKLLVVKKFHEFDSLLDASIKALGGAVIPKVNRKSPKDATWIGFNRSLKCYSPGDIYLLLKTSDLVSEVLEDPYKDCIDDDDVGGAASRRIMSARTTSPYFVVLKEWVDSWGPEMEFRCFICANQLIAVCQRDLDTCHSSIVKRKDKLLVNIQNFFLKNIQNSFPIDYYIMDIICHPNGEIYVVDFDVFGLVTDPLLFTYRELEEICYENMICDRTRTTRADNRLNENRAAAVERESTSSSTPRMIQPCLRFLTESRNFRARKTMGHSALTNDVMTYVRECVPRK